MTLFNNLLQFCVYPHRRAQGMFCLFVVFPLWVVLPLLFISNKASLVAKVGLRLPGSREHLGAPEPGAL